MLGGPRMAGARRAGPPVATVAFFLLLLLLPEPTAAQAPIMSQVSNLLLTMTSAVNTYHELRNMTARVIGGGRGRAKGAPSLPILPRPATPPAPTPISDAPFSVRVLKVEGIGGPTYDWKVSTQAVTPNLTIGARDTTRVKFVTNYTRTRKDFKAYGVKGVVELRNNQMMPIQIDGPVKVLMNMKRPVGITSGPESINITHIANCGPATPIVVPPARFQGRGKIAGTLLCTFEAQLPRSDALLASAEAALAAIGNAPEPEEEEPALPANDAVSNATTPSADGESAEEAGPLPGDAASTKAAPYSVPAVPAAPVAPVQPPVAPVAPVGSVQPSQGISMAPLPAGPLDPWAPQPASPLADVAPAVPTTPAAPAAPSVGVVSPAVPPASTSQLATPAWPEWPAIAPAVPAAPLSLGAPLAPVTPVVPAAPAVPVAPVLPAAPGVPAAPLDLPKSAIQAAPLAAPTNAPANPALLATPAAPLATPAVPTSTPVVPVTTPAAPLATPVAPVATPVATTVAAPAVPVSPPLATPAAPVSAPAPAPALAAPAAPTNPVTQPAPAPVLANTSSSAGAVPGVAPVAAAPAVPAAQAPAVPKASPAVPAVTLAPTANTTAAPTATVPVLEVGKAPAVVAVPTANSSAVASKDTGAKQTIATPGAQEAHANTPSSVQPQPAVAPAAPVAQAPLPTVTVTQPANTTPAIVSAPSAPSTGANNSTKALDVPTLEAGKLQVAPAPVVLNNTTAAPDRVLAVPINSTVATPSSVTPSSPAANTLVVPQSAAPATRNGATPLMANPPMATPAPSTPLAQPAAPSSTGPAPIPVTTPVTTAPVALTPNPAPTTPITAAPSKPTAPISLAPLPQLDDPDGSSPMPAQPVQQAVQQPGQPVQPPLRPPPRRGRRGGVRAASLDVSAPRSSPLPPGVVRAASLNAAADIAATQAEALVPDVSISVLAKPLMPPAAGPLVGLPAANVPAASSPPYKAWFEAPEKACVVANEVLSGPLAKYLIPTGSSLPSGVRTICAPTASHTFDALLGNFDASACGAGTLSNGAKGALANANAATVNVNVVGCKEARATITLSKLQTIRVFNQTWTARVAVLPVLDKTANTVPNRTLNIPAGGTATARFGLQLVKSPPPPVPSYRLRGEVTIKTTSMMPEVMPSTRLVITSTDGSVRNVPISCAPTVLLMSARCVFDIPWPTAGTGGVQAQLKTLLSRNFDTTSGTPKAFDFSTAEEQRPGNCIRVARTYVGHSVVNTTAGLAPERPFVSLVNGVDALLGAVNLNLSSYGLPASSVGQLFGLAGRRRLFQAPADQGEVTIGDGTSIEAEDAAGGEEAAKGANQQPAVELPLPPAEPSQSSSFETALVTGRLRYVHPLAVPTGQAPPGPASRTPLQICKSQDLTWTEQFGHAPVEACGELYNALSTFILTPLGRGSQPPIKFNASLPVLVAACDLRPQLKILSVRTAALNGTVWNVTAKPLDPAGLKITDPARPINGRFTATYARTFKLGSYSIEAAAVLQNPFAKELPVRGVFATVLTPDSPPITARLTCKGAQNGTGEMVLPAAPNPKSPVPIACIGSVHLPGPTAGTITITAATARGDVTSTPATFDVTHGVDQVTFDEATRCTHIEGNFSKAEGEEVAGLIPTKIGIGAPRPQFRTCESRRFTFNATFGPYGLNSCGHFMAHFVASIPSSGASTRASTPIVVSGCPAPQPTFAIASIRTVNVTKRFTWSVDRRISFDGASKPLSGFVALDASTPKTLQHIVTYRRSLATQQATKEYRVAGTVAITNPSDQETIGIDNVAVALRRGGTSGVPVTEVQLPVVCGSSKSVTLGPAASLRCNFDGAVSGAVPGTARVVASLHDGRTASSTVAAAVTFAKAVAVAHGECATITDDFTVLSAPSAAGQNASAREAVALRYVGEKPPASHSSEAAVKLCGPKEFRMTWQLGPFTAGQCGTYTFGGSASARPISSSQAPVSSPGGKLLDVSVSGCPQE